MKHKKGKKTVWGILIVVLLASIAMNGYLIVSKPNIPVSPTNNQSNSVYVVWSNHVRQDRVVGNLRDIDWSGGTLDHYTYRLSLTITVGDTGDQTTYYFSQSELSRLSAFTLSDGKKQQIPLKELKRGDRVVIDTKSDLLKGAESNLLEFKITKM